MTEQGDPRGMASHCWPHGRYLPLEFSVLNLARKAQAGPRASDVPLQVPPGGPGTGGGKSQPDRVLTPMNGSSIHPGSAGAASMQLKAS